MMIYSDMYFIVLSSTYISPAENQAHVVAFNTNTIFKYWSVIFLILVNMFLLRYNIKQYCSNEILNCYFKRLATIIYQLIIYYLQLLSLSLHKTISANL